MEPGEYSGEGNSRQRKKPVRVSEDRTCPVGGAWRTKDFWVAGTERATGHFLKDQRSSTEHLMQDPIG